MRKGFFVLPALAAFAVLAGCATINLSQPLQGKYALAVTAFKNYEVIGLVSITSTEVHTVGPLGFVKKVEGTKITHGDLVRAAAGLDADEVIDVRIEMNTSGKAGFFDWLVGWQRVFTYTGEATAIKYTGEARKPETGGKARDTVMNITVESFDTEEYPGQEADQL